MSIFSVKQTNKKNEFQSEPENNNTHFIHIVDQLIHQGMACGASDIHIEPVDMDRFRIRMRIDGNLHPSSTITKQTADGLITRIKILAKIDIAEKRLPQDGSFRQNTQNRQINIRVSTLPTTLGEKIVLRILDASQYIRALDVLGFNDRDYRIITSMLSRPQGLILVTGPTGCGKSTTVYSLLNALDANQNNITTIEDPIEIQMAGVNQMQVNEKAGLHYNNGLRAILRQDPNVIMIGEIRDEQTALAACRAALTGHLVLSTLHTRSSHLTIDRLIDMNVPKYLLDDVLEGVISQRLVRLLCPKCKKSRMMTANETQMLKLKEPAPIAESSGCEHCRYTGYRQRRAVFEILSFPQKYQRRANKNQSDSFSPKTFIPLAQSIRQMIIRGETSYDEGIRIINL